MYFAFAVTIWSLMSVSIKMIYMENRRLAAGLKGLSGCRDLSIIRCKVFLINRWLLLPQLNGYNRSLLRESTTETFWRSRSRKSHTILYTFPQLRWIERPPPKRQVGCSSHLGNAGKIAESLDFSEFSAFFILVSKLGFANMLIHLKDRKSS